MSSNDARSKEGIGRRAMLVFASNLLGGILGYVSLFYMYRYIGSTAPGVLAFGLSYVGLVSIVADLGYGSAHTKRISEGKDMARCLGVFLVVRIALTTTYLIVGVVGYFLLKSTSAEQTLTPYHEQMIYIILVYQAIILLSDVFRISYMARLQVAKAYISPNVENVVRPCLIVAIALMHSSHPLGTEYEVAIYIGYAYLIGGIAYLLTSIMFVSGLNFGRPDKEMLRSYTKFALPVVIGMAGGTILMNTDKFFLQIFWGTDEVGQYFGAQRIALIITYIGSAIGVILFPLMSELISSGNKQKVMQIVLMGERYLSMAGMPALILLLAIPRQIIHITLSDDLLPVTSAMIIITIYGYISLLNVPYNNIFAAHDRPQIGTNITVFSAVINVVLIILLVPTSFLGLPGLGLKAYGAAIATLIAGCIATVRVRYYAHKLSGVWSNNKVFIHIIAAALSIAMLSFLANGLSPFFGPIYPVTRFYDLAIYGLLSAGLFVGVLFILREFGRDDFKLVKSVIHPIEMVSYIRDETTKKGR
jgi:O-antigen/teichoic acid export membrane protein